MSIGKHSDMFYCERESWYLNFVKPWKSFVIVLKLGRIWFVLSM